MSLIRSHNVSQQEFQCFGHIVSANTFQKSEFGQWGVSTVISVLVKLVRI